MDEIQVADRIRDQFKEYDFGPPAEEKAISTVEAALGCALPKILRACYSRFSYFVGPAQAHYLLPPGEIILEHNRYLRTDFPEEGFEQFVFFGQNSKQQFLGASREDTPRFISFFGYMTSPQELGTDLVKVFQDDITSFEEAKMLWELNDRLRKGTQ